VRIIRCTRKLICCKASDNNLEDKDGFDLSFVLASVRSSDLPSFTICIFEPPYDKNSAIGATKNTDIASFTIVIFVLSCYYWTWWSRYMHLCSNRLKRKPSMKISYNKLWKMLIDRKMNKTDLREKTKMGSNTMAKLGRDETISMDVMLRICDVLHCDVGDIMEVLPDDESGSETK
jgi:DNA-binding Xre family transcriptional regulator